MLFIGFPGKSNLDHFGYKRFMTLGMPLSIIVGVWLLKKALEGFRRRRGLQDVEASDPAGTVTSHGHANELNARGTPVYAPEPAQGIGKKVFGMPLILPAPTNAAAPSPRPVEDQPSTIDDHDETYIMFSDDDLITISDNGDSSVLIDNGVWTNESHGDSGFDEDDSPDEDDGKNPTPPSNNPPTPAPTQPRPARIIRPSKSLIKDVIPPYRDRDPGRREDLLGLRVRVVGAGLPHKGLYGRVRDFRIGEQDAWVEIDRDLYWAFLYQTDALQVINEYTGLDVAAGPGLAW